MKDLIIYQIEGGFKHQIYNWYGTSYGLTDLQRANIDASQTYLTGEIGGHLQLENSILPQNLKFFPKFWKNSSK